MDRQQRPAGHRPRPRIVTLGDLIVDVVAAASGPLARGSDRAGRITFRQGGSAANVARWVARSGGEAVFIGAVGRDEWGRRLQASLTDAGVQTHVVAKRAPTARVVALVEPDGERTFVTDRGAASLLRPSDLRSGWFAGAAALHLPGYSLYHDPLAAAARRAAELARGAGRPDRALRRTLISVDLASRQPILDLGPRAAWSRIAAVAADILFGNEAEAEALLDGRLDSELLGLAPIVVVKRGGAALRIHARSGLKGHRLEIDVPARPIEARDTTGAGDAFAAGFLVRWLATDQALATDQTVLTRPTSLRRAALAGHRAAARLLTSPRQGILT